MPTRAISRPVRFSRRLLRTRKRYSDHVPGGTPKKQISVLVLSPPGTARAVYFEENMSNRLPWLKHDTQASEDTWLRKVIRNQGLEAGWIWWGLCEQMQSYGVGNKFTRDITDMANYSCTSPRVLVRVLVELALEVPLEPGVQPGVGVEVEQKVCWYRIKNELTIEIKNWRKNQDKLRIKTDSKPIQNTPQPAREEEEDVRRRIRLRILKEREKDSTAGDKSGDKFPTAIPRLCTYTDKGQGPCSEPRAERSLYCQGHKDKVAEKYHDKKNDRGGGLTSASEVIEKMPGGES